MGRAVPEPAAVPGPSAGGAFAVRVEIHSTASLKSIYSPSHDVDVHRDGDHKAVVGAEVPPAAEVRDFQLYWTVDPREVGLSLVAHRADAGKPGEFLMLISPRTDAKQEVRVPRDVVFVVDASGSMQGEKMEQARKALKFCLGALDPGDRFAVVRFSTVAETYRPSLEQATPLNIAAAKQWADGLRAEGGTAIDAALDEALHLRTDAARNFTVLFLTDGQPTIGETDPTAILANVRRRNAAGTRIFVFGVGDDVNAHLLDQLAEATRSTSTYVRPREDLEEKVSTFFTKIQRPVFADLTLTLDHPAVKLIETYPPKLPDLFHGGQLVVVGRYTGAGPVAVKLSGRLGDRREEFVYELVLPAEKRENDFLPGLWARRKIGYLLDQIRLSGESKELVDEVVRLAREFGVATPYTSFAAIPDGAMAFGRRPASFDSAPLGGRGLSRLGAKALAG
ncbi:MAG: VWA domain-containing protein, partial [Planctomycetia bacterium]